MNTQLKHPCATCPFRKSSTPGHLGGSPAHTFIGQVNGPFYIPCHSTIDYSDPEWNKSKAMAVPHCAGAAIFRANTGTPEVAGVKIDADKETVFASHAEFLAHHEGITVREAEHVLRCITPDDLTMHEYTRAGLQVKLTPKK